MQPLLSTSAWLIVMQLLPLIIEFSRKIDIVLLPQQFLIIFRSLELFSSLKFATCRLWLIQLNNKAGHTKKMECVYLHLSL